MFSLISTVSLEPEPIPLDVKVVLVGDRLVYYLLHYFDPDFAELFKVIADFEETMANGSETNLLRWTENYSEPKHGSDKIHVVSDHSDDIPYSKP